MKTVTPTTALARGARGLADLFRSLGNRARIAFRDTHDAHSRWASRSTISVEERQAELVQFYDRYEDLVDTLCDAAQYGPTSSLESRYLQLRASFYAQYPAVRPYVIAFLQVRVGDEQVGLNVSGKGSDAFEALVAPHTLADFLRNDDGLMIDRIGRTREALTLYGEHLRQLSSKTA